MAKEKKVKWTKKEAEVEVVLVPIDQLEGVERNPRSIQDDDFRKLMQDINRDPEFLNQRPLLVNRVEGRLVVYGGHQRLNACKTLGHETVPCSIEDNLDEETMKRRVVADNTHFGVFDDEKFGQFADDDLEHLGLVEIDDGDLDLGPMEGVHMGGGDLQNDPKDKSAKEERKQHGKHAVDIVFASEEEKETFDELAKNHTPKDGRFEDWLVEELKNEYE
jgi:hypothetical protein